MDQKTNQKYIPLAPDCKNPNCAFLDLTTFTKRNQPSDKTNPIITLRSYRGSFTIASSFLVNFFPTVDVKFVPHTTKDLSFSPPNEE